jgi:hypothetical protein
VDGEHSSIDNPDDIEAISVITISDSQKADAVSGLSEADQQVFDALTAGDPEIDR